MTLSPRGLQLIGAVRLNFELLKEHDKVSRAEVDQICAAIVDHLRAFRPLLLTSITATETRNA